MASASSSSSSSAAAKETATSRKDAPPSAAAGDTSSPFSCFTDTHGVLTSTMNDLPGYRVVRVLGAVYGLTVRSRNWGADIGAVLRSVVGGEIGLFTRLMYSSRNEALERLVGEVMGRGGNAVVALRFDCGALGTFSQITYKIHVCGAPGRSYVGQNDCRHRRDQREVERTPAFSLQRRSDRRRVERFAARCAAVTTEEDVGGWMDGCAVCDEWRLEAEAASASRG